MDNIKIKKCICEENDLEQGDTLYTMSSWDGGIGFDYIRDIKYCPVCGRELPRFEEIYHGSKS